MVSLSCNGLFKKALESNYTKLIELIDVEHGLLTELKDRDVLNSLHIEDINSQIQGYKKTEKLLDILLMRADYEYKEFYQALKATKQFHAIDCLAVKPEINISSVPLGKQDNTLPWKMLELIVLKSTVVFQKFYRFRILPRADVVTYITLCSVCEEWRTIMKYMKYCRYIRRKMQHTLHKKLTCDVPLELLKAAVILRRVETAAVTRSVQPPLSPLSLEHHPLEKIIQPAQVTKPIEWSERDIDSSVLTTLATVCRHWKVTLKTRSDVSRRQLSLMMHDERMRRMVKKQSEHRDKVLESLNVSDDLIGELQSSKCISDRQNKRLRKLSTRKKCSRLLDIMILKNREEYNTFIGIMRRTGRQHIAVLLETTHVIPGHVIVRGVTTIKNELFVLRARREEGELLIEVYLTETFELTRKLNVEWIRNVGWWGNELTACEKNNCVYVCSWRECTVCKVNLNAVDEQVKWRVDSRPRGLSVNKECNVLIACRDDTIQEYTPSGSLVRRVTLQLEVSYPRHAVELSNGHYAVSYDEPVYGICVVDRKGQVVSSYQNDGRSNTIISRFMCFVTGFKKGTRKPTKPLADPCSIAVTTNDCILVADCDNNRIIIFDSSLSCARDLRLSRDDQLELPNCIHIDESRDRLYVGELTGQVVILDNVFDIHH